MALVMEVNMMVTEAAETVLYVGVTIVSSLELTSILRTTAVSSQMEAEVGDSGERSAPAVRVVVLAGGPDTDTAKVLAVLTPLSPSRDFVTLSLADLFILAFIMFSCLKI